MEMMRNLYRKYIAFLERLPEKHQYVKMYIAERLALGRKRYLTRSVNWNKRQDKEFEEFWKSNYKNIRKDGHKLYESFNGQFNVDYVPDFLYATKVEYSLNDYKYANIYSDKALTEILYKNKSEAVLPKTILLNAGGVFYNGKRKVINKEEVNKILRSIQNVVIKPTVGGSSGIGVLVLSFDVNGYDSENKIYRNELMSKYKQDFIIQEKIVQSDSLNKLYPQAINTFRVISYIANSAIHIAPVNIRIGTGGSRVDNIHAGGISVTVNIVDQTLSKIGYQLGWSDSNVQLERHPDTGIVFENYKIEGINKLSNTAKMLHGHTPHIGIISWDFTLNQENMPVLIEANYIGQAVWLSQITTGKPFFGDQTKDILKIIR